MSAINWKADLDQLARELPILHKNLFFSQEKSRFYARIRTLKENVDTMETYAIIMELARIVAAIGDAHTMVAVPRFNRLPLECYWFCEGIFITAVLPQFAELLHAKIVKIAGIPIDRVVGCLSAIVAHENQNFLRSQLPDYLICADILWGLGIIKDIKNIDMTVEKCDGQIWNIIIPTTKYADFQPSSLSAAISPEEQLLLYRKNKDKYFWSKFDVRNKLLYINYSKCKDMSHCTVKEFSGQLIKGIKHNRNIQKLVIDMRNNSGGNSELFKGYLRWLSQFDLLNCPGRLFVIVGRDTFSSALLNTYYLKYQTHAIFLGEPTGGKPNCYGEVNYMSLHSSGLYIRYSTKYYELVDDDAIPAFIPDMVFEVTFADYLRKVDPCMEWIYHARTR